MSVVAWDGRSLAADQQATSADMRVPCSKMCRLSDGVVLAWVGDHEYGLLLKAWYEDGARKEKWPDFQRDEKNWCRLIVWDGRQLAEYEQRPIAQPLKGKFMAWGSGRNYAMGAMAAGKTAAEAAMIAQQFDIYSGLGVEVFDLSKTGR